MGIPQKAARFAASRRVGAFSAVVLVVFLVPQFALRVMPSTGVASHLVVMGALVGSSLLVFFALAWQERILPRSSNPRLVATYIGERTSVVLSSARFVSYALIVVMGAGLAVGGLSALIDLSGYGRIVLVATVIVLAFPGIFGSRPPSLVLYLGAGFSVLALAVLLIYGLIAEVSGGFSEETLAATREYMANTAQYEAGPFSLHAVALVGLLPSGMLILAIDRRSVRSEERAGNIRMQGWRAVFAFVAILITLYFESSLQMSANTRALPVLAMAYGLFGSAGHSVLSIAAIIAGMGAVVAAYGTLPRLVHDLSVDRILPRHFATENSPRPRVLAVSITAGLAALVAAVTYASQSPAMMFVFTTFAIFTLSCAAMGFRGSSILKESVSKEERARARVSRWIFGLCALCGVGVLVGIAWIRTGWAATAIVTLLIPAALLIFFRRGRVRVVRQLAATDLTAGRTLPTRVHGVVLVSALDLPTLRAVSFARAARLSSLTAVTLDFDPRATKDLRQDWRAAALPVELTVLGTPEGAGPQNIVDYVRSLRQTQRADIVMVYIPRLVPTGVWQRFFVRHSEPRIMSDLRLQDGVVIAEVPYQLQPQDEE